MNSPILQKARTYEAQYGEAIPASERPVYHLTPWVGWMNDPNGFSFYQGQYHLFYQYYPYKTVWGPMHWGHAVSRDLLRWEYLPAAMAPDMPYDKDGCFSGSAAELPDGRQLLLYTGVCKSEDLNPEGHYYDIQTQCVAVGDGVNYEKIPQNPVLTVKDLPEGYSKYDFRDPKIWQEPDGTYSAVAVARTEDKSGAVILYHSPDGFEWHFVTVLDHCRNEHGRMWECPDFFELDGRYLLLLSPQEMQARDEFHAGHATIYLVGDYDPETHTFRREDVHLADYGIDFYATQTLLAPDGRRIMTAWLQTWSDIEDKPQGAKWFGQMICPRELHLKDGRLIQAPIRELEAARTNRVYHENVSVSQPTTLEGIRGRVADLTVNVAPDGELYRSFTIKMAADGEHYTSLTYDTYTSRLTIDRSHAGSHCDFVHSRSCEVRRQDGALKLRILLDRNSIEVFANDGEQVMTVWLYTHQSADGISFSADGKVKVTAEQYDLSF